MLNNLQKNLELVNEFNKSVGYKLITHKSVVFFYTSNWKLHKNTICRVICIYRTFTRKWQSWGRKSEMIWNRSSVSIDWKSLHSRDASSLQISQQIKCSSYQSSVRIFADTDEIILNFCGKAKELGWLKHCEKDVIEVTDVWFQDSTEQWNRIENQEIIP